jgi:hyperosmotically inducible periplasmic protein
MSFLSRSVGTIALALLTVLMIGTTTATAQVNTVKDGWLVMKVHSEFVNEDLLDGSNIDVDVKNGVVTLQGTVTSEAGKARAQELARKNDGVKNVVNQLRIAPAHDNRAERAMDKTKDKTEKAADKTARAADKAEDKAERGARKTGRAIDDGWIKSKIYAQYLADWNTVLDDSDIDIDVNNNMVTLNGTVKTAAAKAKAVSIAKATDGVKGVKDNLRVGAGTR